MGIFRFRTALFASSLFLTLGRLAGAAETLSWDDAVQLAATNNPDLRSAREAFSAAESRVKAAAWSFGPRLSADARAGRDGRGGAVSEPAYSATLGVNQNLFSWSDVGNLRQSRAGKEAQAAALAIAKAGLSRDLKTAFASLLFAQRSLELAGSIVARRTRNLDLVQLRYEGGRENRGALSLSQANSREAELGELQARNSIRTAGTRLRAVLGLNGDLNGAAPFTLSGEVPVRPAPRDIDARSLAMNVPERAQALAVEGRSRAAVTTARGSLLPSAALSANMGKFGDRFFPQTDGWSLSLNLSFPFGDGGTYHGLQAARAEAAAAAYDRASIELDLKARLESAHATRLEAEARVGVAQFSLTAARTRAEIARQRYETGLVSFDEWDRIETDLITRETAVLQAKRDRVAAEAAWEFILGEGVIP